jgi:hypothetical protein
MRTVILATWIALAVSAGMATPAGAGDPQPDNRGASHQSQVQPGDDRDQQSAPYRDPRHPDTQPQAGASGAREGGASAPGSSSATTATPPSGTAPSDSMPADKSHGSQPPRP